MVVVGALLGLTACGRFGFGPPDEGTPSDGGAGGDDPDAAVDRPNRIFVTSTTFASDLGGLDGADDKCQSRATSAGLEGTFVAFLETTTILDPASRLAGSRGWVDLTGLPIADEAASLQAGTLFPLRVDETGAQVAHREYAWRGGGGSPTNPPETTCLDWTSSTGGTASVHEISVDASFDTTTFTVCDMPRRLVCAESGHVAAVAVSPQSGRIAFITEGQFTPGGGLSAADNLCSTEASAAMLPGTYRAFLRTGAATAESRFSAAGEPWRRVDGVRLTLTATELLDTAHTFWETFIARTAKGAVTNQRVWVGTSTNHCGDWMDTALNGSIGQSHSSDRARLLLFPAIGCNSAFALICLQV